MAAPLEPAGPTRADPPDTADRRAGLFDLRLPVSAFALAVAGILWLAISAQISADREQAIELARRDNANLARAFEEHTLRTLTAVDQVALQVKRQVETVGTGFDLARFHAERQPAGDVVKDIAVVDAEGAVVMGTMPFNPTNLADREHVRVQIGRAHV